MEPAPEPTDIIWEHRHISEAERSIKKVLVFIVIIITLLISAFCVYSLERNVKLVKNKYASLECKNVDGLYGNFTDLPLYDKHDPDRFPPSRHREQSQSRGGLWSILLPL